jgi:hypothetical protein
MLMYRCPLQRTSKCIYMYDTLAAAEQTRGANRVALSYAPAQKALKSAEVHPAA